MTDIKAPFATRWLRYSCMIWDRFPPLGRFLYRWSLRSYTKHGLPPIPED